MGLESTAYTTDVTLQINAKRAGKKYVWLKFIKKNLGQIYISFLYLFAVSLIYEHINNAAKKDTVKSLFLFNK